MDAEHQNILDHYDALARLARARCTSQADAEDLVADTMLAAFSFLHRGGTIEHPKTWLVNTMMHIQNGALRRKYRDPVVVGLDALGDIAEEDEAEDAFAKSEEAAEVRRVLNYMASTARSVIIRYYYNGQSVAEIAQALGIPEGTVKSRLHAGRAQVKKGLERMENRKNQLAGELEISWGGRDGPNGEPTSLVQNDLIAQNLLILAYDKPVTMCELADMIGIPTVYIEPIVKKLVDGELMVRTEGDRYHTDFIIFQPDDCPSRFDGQIAFAKQHFDAFWTVLEGMVENMRAMPYTATLSERKKQKLERYAVLHALQTFVLSITGDGRMTPPARRDGGRWIAHGWSTPAEYDWAKHSEKENRSYMIWGGHRTNWKKTDFYGTDELSLCEFDTAFWDHPGRFNIVGFHPYFEGMARLLWCVERGIDPSEAGIHGSLIEAIPDYVEKTGLLAREDGVLKVDIPVMEKAIYRELIGKINEAVQRLRETVGEAFGAFLKGQAVRLPAHLTSVPMEKRYMPATAYIEMAVVHEAHERGLHMKGVDYCCPPVLLVYQTKES